MNAETTDLIIIAVILAIGAVLALVAWRRLSGRSGLPDIDDTPDRPVRFGWKIYWLAVPADDTDAVVSALQASDRRFADSEARRCNWRSALDRIFANFHNPEVFVTPPVDGWVLLVNWEPSDETVDDYRSTLEGLSSEFGEAYAFGSHRGVGLSMYAAARDGELLRCVYQADGTQYIDVGETLREEEELGFLTMDEVVERTSGEIDDHEADAIWQRLPGEQEVVDLAAELSLDPTSLGEVEETGVGRLLRPS